MRKKISLSKSRIDELERLLRNWTQDIMTQMALLGATDELDLGSVRVRGIVASTEDKEIIEGRL